MSEKIFLSATWQYLAMLNYEVDGEILLPHLPPGTEPDLYNGKSLVSVVGFLFNNTKVLGMRWPWHTHFEEVNLRYYVKRKVNGAWRRGTAFISEIVPKPIIAKTANLLYNEHYSTARMKHRIEVKENEIEVYYDWRKRAGNLNTIEVLAQNKVTEIAPGSEAEFILEHYYGYNKLNSRTSIEYAVEHPRWQIYPVTHSRITCDVAALYGTEFVPFLKNVPPHSVFLARGSDVIVRKPVKIKMP
jgi:uncharacterized protein